MGMGLTVIISRITEHFEPQVHSPWPHNRKSGSKLGYALTRFQKPILGSTGSGELLHGPFAYYPSHRLGSDMSGPFSISQLCHSPPLQVTFGIRNILVNHRLVCSVSTRIFLGLLRLVGANVFHLIQLLHPSSCHP